MKILVLNCGSSSLKYQLINMETEEVLASGKYERIGEDEAFITHKVNGQKIEIKHPAKTHEEAVDFTLKQLINPEYKVIDSLDEISAIGHRLVHGGEKINKSVIITDEVVEVLKECIDLAPLHNPAGIIGIEACKKVMPGKPMVGVFDTAFSASTLPEENYIYAVPYEWYEKYGVRRYGYHGTSHRYIYKTICNHFGKDNLKVISCHNGNGASITAIDSGKVVDTTLGFSSLVGLIMGTRCGDIDVAIVQYMMNKTGKSIDEVMDDLYKRSGLLGISGVSSDSRDVEIAAEEGNERAILANEMYAQKIANYIAMYNNELGGADVITLTAGIGENSKAMRKSIIQKIASLGVKLDEERNDFRGEFRLISTEDSKIPVYVVPTDEEMEIALETYEIKTKNN